MNEKNLTGLSTNVNTESPEPWARVDPAASSPSNDHGSDVTVAGPLPDSAQVPDMALIASLSSLEALIDHHYPTLLPSVKCCLAVFGAMALRDRTKPLSVILETSSGYGKTAVVQMLFPIPGSDMDKYVYRSDKFTPRSFVTHAASVAARKLPSRDLLPRLQDKVLVTKELAPIFRGRKEELTDNFSMLISVLDGKGFISDSGMRGRRGYQCRIMFNWIGATTPLPPETHRLMSQLGTRLLFYELPAIEPTDDELLAYAEREDTGAAELECQQAVGRLLMEFLKHHPIGTVPPETIAIPKHFLRQIAQWARFVATGRSEIKYENEGSWTPVSALKPEGPYKLINYLKELARGHALIHHRLAVDQSDLELIAHIAISSIPGHLRPIIRALRNSERLDTPRCQALCRVSDTSARRYMREVDLLGIARLLPGSPGINQPNEITLTESYRWLRQPGNVSARCGLEGEKG